MTLPASIPLEDLIRSRIGSPQCRRGDSSARPWWLCPFHPDRNPSFSIQPNQTHWKCFACGASGDGIDFLRQIDPGLSFKDAAAEAGAGLASPRTRLVKPRPIAHASYRSAPVPPPGWADFAKKIAAEAGARLWSDKGAVALAYLRGRGLTDATIRTACLGFQARDEFEHGVYSDKPVCIPSGITIPWEEDGFISAVNVRRLNGRKPKYHLLRGSKRTIYPGRSALVPGRPLILAEGEFDSLLLAQEVGCLASVVTLGSASDRRPDPSVTLAMAACSPWFIAGDADGAGRANADGWLAKSSRCRRVVPPEGDWTDAFKAGYRLGPWWRSLLSGIDPDGPNFDPNWYEPSSIWSTP